MSLYLSQQTLKEAVDRLAICAAQSSLADYLIFKRALKIAESKARSAREPIPDVVVTGTKAAAFVQAIEEFALTPRDEADSKSIENPYYVPFGSKRDRTLGYRTLKFPSNGSSDTVSRWQSRSAKPLTLVPDTSPKSYRFEQRTKKELEEFFGVKGATSNYSGEKPRLLDTAIWWFRSTNLEDRFGNEPTVEQLQQGFIEDFGLTETEISALFAEGDSILSESPVTEMTEDREGL
ncbi:MAG TPA: hypothetical protein VGD31_09250 [Sphingobacteriaceae bacterium]